VGAVSPAAAVADAGWTVVSDLVTAAERAELVDALEEVLVAESAVGAERGWQTAVQRISYALPVKHGAFLGLCTHPGLLGLARSVLGDDCVVASLNGLDVPPGAPAQRLHRDHPVPTPGTTLFLHVVCPLDPFTGASGATRVVPGTHRGESGAELVVEVGAGGVLAFDGALVHGAGANTTASPRRAVHTFFARPWVQPHWDFPATFGERVSALSEEQRRILGFADRPRRFDREAQRIVR
jgi:ectoine hydroxylase-related dioxygenase (phytanoyl-CoA dioxygenase family)